MAEGEVAFPEPGVETLEAVRHTLYEIFGENPNWTTEGIERVAVAMAGLLDFADKAVEERRMRATGIDET